MRWSAIGSEAWRNVVTGAARAGLLAVVTAVLLTLVVGSDALAVVGARAAHAEFRASGGAIWSLTAAGGIDARRCEALTAFPAIGAAGAMREASSVRLAALPQASLPVHEVSVGMAAVLGASDATAGGVWLAEGVAEDLGLAPGQQVALTAGEPMRVAATFRLPDGATTSTLAYAALAPAAPVGSSSAVGLSSAVGSFDACWIDLLTYDEPTLGLLNLAVTATPKGGSTSVAQLSSRLGRSFDLNQRLAERPTRHLALAAPVLAALVAVAGIRSRRLELASALHVGVRRRDLAAQSGLETAVWAGAAVVIAAAALLAVLAADAAGRAVVVSPLATWVDGLRPLGASWALAVLATLAAVPTVRERTLFRYFRER